MSANVKPTWNFPPLNGGEDVVQDSASEFFADDPIAKLVRETVQNSLDAKKDGLSAPVKVTFTESAINRDLFDGAALGEHLRACRERVDSDNLDKEIGSFYRDAERALRKNVRVLSVVDSGTTGLDTEAKWKALVRQQGAVNKQGAVSGGSFGIGKNAVFNVSALRAALYSTRYLGTAKGDRRRGMRVRMQGKSTLMSHPSPDNCDTLQHVGFLEWPEVRNYSDLPEEFRLDEPGTGVFILGFEPRTSKNREWIDDMLRAVVENFFCAIHDEKLVVEIKSRGEKTETVNRETIESYFDSLYDVEKPHAYHYHRAISGGGSVLASESKLGDLRLHFLPNEGPRRIAYVNRMGMLISDSLDQKVNPVSPRRSALWPDYTAVVVPDTDKGDEWSRRMETPSHDAVSPERLRDPRRKREAQRIFRDARRLIRDAIEEAVGMNERYDESNIHELSEILPDEFDPNLPGNTALVSVEGNPPSVNTIVEVEDERGESDDDGDVEVDDDGFVITRGEGNGGGSGEGGGGGEGGGSGEGGGGEGGGGEGKNRNTDGNGPNRNRNRRSLSRLGKPRYIADGENAYSCSVVFELSESVEGITLTLRPAGAERGEKMSPIRVASASLMGQDLDCGEGGAIQIPNPQVNRRLTVKIQTVESIANRAIVARGDVKA